MGHPPVNADLILKTENLNRILEHAQNDLTVTVESGITLRDLQNNLKTKNQFFPFWEPGDGNRTIGGILSTGSINTFSSRYGHLRDLILGVSVCLPDGTLIKAGSKVVKNVSGYEMPKLFIGSFGTLGCITSATLRLSPIPRKITFLKARPSNPQQGLQILKQFFMSKLLLTFALVHKSSEGPALLIRVEGAPGFVDDQVQQITAMLRDSLGTLPEVSLDTHMSFPRKWESNIGADLMDPRLRGDDKDMTVNAVLCSGFVPPLKLSFLLSEIEKLSFELALEETFQVGMDGAFHIGWDGAPDEQALPSFQKLNKAVAEQGGWIAYHRVPEKLWRDWPMWGEERNEWGLTRKLKALFDPNEILNSGRFVGGKSSVIRTMSF